MSPIVLSGRARSRAFDYADVLLAQIRALRLPEPIRDGCFVPGRKFKTDLAWPDRLLFVELDGGEWTHGRHGRGTGMANDCLKWNALVLEGWTGFRFVGSQVRSGLAIATLERVLQG